MHTLASMAYVYLANDPECEDRATKLGSAVRHTVEARDCLVGNLKSAAQEHGHPGFVERVSQWESAEKGTQDLSELWAAFRKEQGDQELAGEDEIAELCELVEELTARLDELRSDEDSAEDGVSIKEQLQAAAEAGKAAARATREGEAGSTTTGFDKEAAHAAAASAQAVSVRRKRSAEEQTAGAEENGDESAAKKQRAE